MLLIKRDAVKRKFGLKVGLKYVLPDKQTLIFAIILNLSPCFSIGLKGIAK
jgi:hypothetical protein